MDRAAGARSDPRGRTLPRQTADRLWSDLVAGRARSGDRLPSERELAERYRVSRVTVRTALSGLAERGCCRSPRRAAGRWRSHTGRWGRTSGTRCRGSPTTPRGGLTARRPCCGRSPGPPRWRGRPAADRPGRGAVRDAPTEVPRRRRGGRGAQRLPLALCPALATADFHIRVAVRRPAEKRPAQLPRVADYSVEAGTPPTRSGRCWRSRARCRCWWPTS